MQLPGMINAQSFNGKGLRKIYEESYDPFKSLFRSFVA